MNRLQTIAKPCVLLLILIALLLCAVRLLPHTTADVGGDIDGDGSLTTADARAILQYIVGTVVLDEHQLTVADYNVDGIITTADARDVLITVITPTTTTTVTTTTRPSLDNEGYYDQVFKP